MRFSKSETILPECERSVSTAKKQKKEVRQNQWKDTTSWQIFKRNKRSYKWGDMEMNQERLFEKRNLELGIYSTRTSPQSKLDKKEHWWHQKDVECVVKEMSQSLTWLQSAKS